jgi:GntR family transcriptional regulator
MFPTSRDLHDRDVPKIPMSSDQIVNDLAERIRLGEYEPGQQLPTYAVLANLYDVSPATIAIVVRILKERGLVVGVRGRGTYVRVDEPT